MLVAAAGTQPPEGNQSPRSAPQAPPEDDSPLQLRISAPKTTIVQCEPVPVTFELKNVSERLVIVGDLSLSPGSERVPLEITPPGEKPYVIGRALIVSDSSPRDIEPQQSVTYGMLLLHDYLEHGFFFKQPGQYRINATFDDPPRRIPSNTLVFTVKEARGVDAKALQEHWGCNPVGPFMMGSTSDYVIAREFHSILEKYPTSVYAPWCELALVPAHSKRAAHDRWLRKQLRAESDSALTEYAIREYGRFLKTHREIPFPYSVQMPYTVARMKLAIGRKEEALREIEALTKEHPEVDFIKEAAFRIEGAKAEGREVREGGLPP